MITRNQVLQSVNSLPDYFTIDQLIDQLRQNESVEERLTNRNEKAFLEGSEVFEILELW